MKGYIQVYTGNGKGKTTAALGLALRAVGAGLKVYLAQFIKAGAYSEITTLKKLSDSITVEQFGLGRFAKGKPADEDISSGSTPISSTPIGSTPTESTPTESTPTESTPTGSTPSTIEPGLVHLGVQSDSIVPIKKFPGADYGHALQEGRDYTFDPDTSEITFTAPEVLDGHEVTASYKYFAGETFGPFTVEPNYRYNNIIEGVVIGFGKGMQEGDKMIIGIRDTRDNVVDVYGGKWNFNYSLSVYSRDPIKREEVVDYLMAVLWKDLRSFWSSFGIIVDNISLGGETEEVVDDLSGDVQYIQDISIEIISDWEVHIPFTVGTRMDIAFGGHQPSAPDDVKLLEEQGLIAIHPLPTFPDFNNNTERIR